MERRDLVTAKATGGKKYGVYGCYFKKEKHQEV
jgi:hypothetical protein